MRDAHGTKKGLQISNLDGDAEDLRAERKAGLRRPGTSLLERAVASYEVLVAFEELGGRRAGSIFDFQESFFHQGLEELLYGLPFVSVGAPSEGAIGAESFLGEQPLTERYECGIVERDLLLVVEEGEHPCSVRSHRFLVEEATRSWDEEDICWTQLTLVHGCLACAGRQIVEEREEREAHSDSNEPRVFQSVSLVNQRAR